MPEYLYLLHPYRHDFFECPTSQEQNLLKEHKAYLGKVEVNSGHEVILAGNCSDGTFRLVLLRADNEQAASDFMFSDPLVQANAAAAELHPFELDRLRESTGGST